MDTEYQAKIPFDWAERQKWLELSIPLEEYKARLGKLRELLSADGVGCLVAYGGLSDRANLRYVCGYDSWWGDTMLVIPTAGGEPIFVTNAVFHGELAHSNMHTHWIKDIRYVLHPHSTEKPKNVTELVADIIQEWGLSTGRIAVCNMDKVPYYLMSQLGELLVAAELVQGTRYLARLRRIKSPSEIALFRESCAATDAGVNKALEMLRPGVTERQVHATIAGEAYAQGGHGFMGHVGFGPRGAIKNNMVPSDYPLHEGEIVFMDVSVNIAGYSTDMARNALIGEPQDDLSIRMLDAVYEAGQKVLERIGPDVVIYDLQRIMRDHMAGAGLLPYDFTETLFAHGCGLDLVEEPFFFWGNTARLELGMTFFLEPSLVKHGLGTASWENLILITETGYERLNTARDKNW